MMIDPKPQTLKRETHPKKLFNTPLKTFLAEINHYIQMYGEDAIIEFDNRMVDCTIIVETKETQEQFHERLAYEKETEKNKDVQEYNRIKKKYHLK